MSDEVLCTTVTAPVFAMPALRSVARLVYSRSTLSTKIRVSAPSSAPSRASLPRHGNGKVSTHWRSATCSGNTRSTRF